MSDGSVTAEVQGTRVEIEKFFKFDPDRENRFIRVDENREKKNVHMKEK